MKILHISRDFGKESGGVGGYTEILALEALRAGHAVHVLSCGKGGVSDPRLKVFHYEHPMNLRRAHDIFRQLQRENYDIVNFQYVPQDFASAGLSLVWTLFVYRMATAARSRLVMTFHEAYEPFFLARPWRWPIALLQRWQQFLYLCLVRKAIMTTEVHRDRARKWFPWFASKLEYFPVFSNIPDAGKDSRECAAERSRRGITPEEVLVGFVSNTLHPDLRVPTFFHVCHELKNEGVAVRPFFIGGCGEATGPYRRSLDRMAAKWDLRPVWTGRLPADQVSGCLRLLDVYVCLILGGVSTRSTAYLSALAHGRPVLTVESPLMKSFPEFQETVIQFKFDDEETFKNHLKKLARDPAFRRSLGEKSSQFYQAHFRTEEYVSKLQGMYGRLLQDGAAE